MIAPSTNAFDSVAAASEAYRAVGWQIFPCHSKNGTGCTCGKPACSSPAKHPRTENGLLDATTRLDDVSGWVRKFGLLNWGVATGATSGIWTLDEDPRHGGDKTLAEFIARHGELPETIEAATGGGGRHFVFRHPGFDVPNRTGGKAGMPEGLDVRGDGGYIIVAPAMHIEGRQYRWREGRSPLQIEPADAPAWLLEIVTTKKEAPPIATGKRPEANDLDLLTRAATSYIAKAAGVSEGSRDSTAFGIAGHLAAFVVDGSGARLGESQALNLLRTWNDRNSPPLTDPELARACKSAFEGNGTPRADKIIERTKNAPPRKSKSAAGEKTAKLPIALSPEGRTDVANAARYVHYFGESVLWCEQWERWSAWDGTRWAPDVVRAVVANGKTIWKKVAAEIGESSDG